MMLPGVSDSTEDNVRGEWGATRVWTWLRWRGGGAGITNKTGQASPLRDPQDITDETGQRSLSRHHQFCTASLLRHKQGITDKTAARACNAAVFSYALATPCPVPLRRVV
eukprot:3450768-Rhodomonas_salina.2